MEYMEQYRDKLLADTNISISRVLFNPAWKGLYQGKDQSSIGVFLLVLSLEVATMRCFRRRVCCSQGHKEMLKKVSSERQYSPRS